MIKVLRNINVPLDFIFSAASGKTVNQVQIVSTAAAVFCAAGRIVTKKDLQKSASLTDWGLISNPNSFSTNQNLSTLD